MKNKMNHQIKAGFWITFVGIIAVASLIACILIIQPPNSPMDDPRQYCIDLMRQLRAREYQYVSCTITHNDPEKHDAYVQQIEAPDFFFIEYYLYDGPSQERFYQHAGILAQGGEECYERVILNPGDDWIKTTNGEMSHGMYMPGYLYDDLESFETYAIDVYKVETGTNCIFSIPETNCQRTMEFHFIENETLISIVDKYSYADGLTRTYDCDISWKTDDEIRELADTFLEEARMCTGYIQAVETNKDQSDNFEEIPNERIELNAYYPQDIPDGYNVTFISDGTPLQMQDVRYENDSGDLITYWVYSVDMASFIEINEVEKETDVIINGIPGILYEQEGNTRTLIWINEDQGYGCAIRTKDTAVDLIAMAKSTAEGEPLIPTRSAETVKALKELGDFSPEYLPEGYEEVGVQGSPLPAGGWYSYVRRWYANKTANTSIYFEYETYAIDTDSGYTDDARTICSLKIPGNDILNGLVNGQEVEISGMYGLATENDIVWADPEIHKVYHLYSEDVTGEELLQVAYSVYIN